MAAAAAIAANAAWLPVIATSTPQSSILNGSAPMLVMPSTISSVSHSSNASCEGRVPNRPMPPMHKG